MTLSNIALGKAGELRVASELLLRGYDAFLTIADSGTDIVLGNGKRLQVKTARQGKEEPRGTGTIRRYAFSFKSWRKKEGRYVPHPLNNVDFVVLWAVEHNAFFIVPVDVIRGHSAVAMNLSESSLWTWKRGLTTQVLSFRERWDLLG